MSGWEAAIAAVLIMAAVVAGVIAGWIRGKIIAWVTGTVIRALRERQHRE